jgi:hypothetical protein
MTHHDEGAPDLGGLRIRPDSFGALRAFLRGYLHQDYEVEHGDPMRAADAFAADAGRDDLTRLVRDWERLRQRLALVPERVRLAVVRALGSDWEPSDWKDVEALFERLRAALDARRER